ncbi:MAG: hypothetical protein PUG48_10730 [Clostridia bacterium]|nr:hypothetical protein [Clostridia bacterium]
MANYQTQLQSLGYNYVQSAATGYAKFNGIPFMVKIDTPSKTYIVSASCCPQDENGAVTLNSYLQQFSADRKKTVNMANYSNNTISIVYKMGMSTDITANVKEATDAIMYFVAQSSCIPVCNACGQQVATDFYSVRGNVHCLCPNCFNRVQSTMLQQANAESQTSVNYPLGILGAVLGGLVGAVLWVIFSMMGKVVVAAGLVAGFLGVLLFEKLGKKLTLPGLFISLGISLVMLLIGMYFALGIDIYNELKEYITFSEAFSLIPYVFSDSEIIGAIIHDWGFGIIGYILTAVVSIGGFFNKRKVQNQAVRLS